MFSSWLKLCKWNLERLTFGASSYGLFKATDKKLLDSEDFLNRISTAENIAKE
jgi:nucleolar protein 58